MGHLIGLTKQQRNGRRQQRESEPMKSSAIDDQSKS
jgi:hypothetical protein